MALVRSALVRAGHMMFVHTENDAGRRRPIPRPPPPTVDFLDAYEDRDTSSDVLRTARWFLTMAFVIAAVMFVYSRSSKKEKKKEENVKAVENEKDEDQAKQDSIRGMLDVRDLYTSLTSSVKASRSKKQAGKVHTNVTSLLRDAGAREIRLVRAIDKPTMREVIHENKVNVCLKLCPEHGVTLVQPSFADLSLCHLLALDLYLTGHVDAAMMGEESSVATTTTITISSRVGATNLATPPERARAVLKCTAIDVGLGSAWQPNYSVIDAFERALERALTEKKMAAKPLATSTIYPISETDVDDATAFKKACEMAFAKDASREEARSYFRITNDRVDALQTECEANVQQLMHNLGPMQSPSEAAAKVAEEVSSLPPRAPPHNARNNCGRSNLSGMSGTSGVSGMSGMSVESGMQAMRVQDKGGDQRFGMIVNRYVRTDIIRACQQGGQAFEKTVRSRFVRAAAIALVGTRTTSKLKNYTTRCKNDPGFRLMPPMAPTDDDQNQANFKAAIRVLLEGAPPEADVEVKINSLSGKKEVRTAFLQTWCSIACEVPFDLLVTVNEALADVSIYRTVG